MKTLPPSWVKNKENKQLSFTDSLFDKPTEEDVFVERFLNTLRNAKWLRYRLNHSSFKKGEKIACDLHWNEILEAGASILSKVARKSIKFKHRTLDDFIHDVFIERIDHPPSEYGSKTAILQHHDNVTGSITGILLASKPLLRGMTKEVKNIMTNIESSKTILHRL